MKKLILVAAALMFVAACEDTPPPPATTGTGAAVKQYMVFFDFDRSNITAQAAATIKQAADARRRGIEGEALKTFVMQCTGAVTRIAVTGHTDTSGSATYNMALSLRRANAVKDALVREGVPAQAISVVGRGEQGLLVQTGDGVREPQNRRVEIVIQ